MDVVLPPALADFVHRKVASGAYADAREVISDALRMMQEREDGYRRAAGRDEVVTAIRAMKQELALRGVRSAALFGSVIHNSARPDSDVDVLIEVDPGVTFDLIDLAGVRNLLCDRLGRAIDVVEKDALRPEIRDGVLGEAETVF